MTTAETRDAHHLPGAARYDHTTVDGWFEALDRTLFEAILARQLGDGTTGDLCEIGALSGRSAILLGYGLRLAREKLVVCDLFESAVAHGHMPVERPKACHIERFERNWDAHHVSRPEVYVCESRVLDDHLDRDGAFRFIHIDGCHSYQCVKADIELAARRAGPNGVIAFDDYRTKAVPGVAQAIWGAAELGRIYPFAGSDAKVYAAINTDARRYWTEFIEHLVAAGVVAGEVYTYPDHDFMVVSDIA
jgi:predicted O-methyltransferase YrrM